MLEPSFYSYLTTALPSLKLYAARLPERASFPSSVYLVVATTPEYVISGFSGLSKARVQVDSWGTSYADAANGAESIRTKLEGYKGTWGSLSIAGVSRINTFAASPESSDDGSDTYRYRVISEYYIWFYESIPTFA